MFDVVEKNILEIQEALNSGVISSKELVEEYQNRIKTIDKGEVKYNSILEINPDSIDIAISLDKERSEGKIRSLMHGIPVILKDNINTLDKMHTTAGSLALKDNYANYEATLVKNLRANGAIILGKANLSEFANFMSYNMRNGYSSLGKEVLCPFNLDEDPSGSSAGSAVSVTLNLTPVSIGSETGGSIMSPATKNGVVGIKPTMGLVSRNGIVPISSTLDTAGPIAKSVTDAAILLGAIRSNDPLDLVTTTKEDKNVDYTKFLDKNGLKGSKIGIDRTNYNTLSDNAKDVFDRNLKVMKEAGAVLVEDLKIKQTKHIFYVMKFEFKYLINSYLESLGENTKVKSLEEIIQFNKDNETECLKYGQKLLEDCQNGTSGKMNERKYHKALKERSTATEKLNKIFTINNLDIIYFASYTSLGPHCGFPTMTIPSGLEKNNIPLGTYFLAPKYKEENLIRIGYSLEQIIKTRVNPLK